MARNSLLLFLSYIMNEETKEKIRMTLIGRHPSKETCEKRSKSLKGRIFSEEHRKKLSEAAYKRDKSTQVLPKTIWKKGNIPWNYHKPSGLKCHYIDGRTSLLQNIRHSFKTHEWIKACYIRDDYTCSICKVRGGNLCVHHKYRTFHSIYNEFIEKYNNITEKEILLKLSDSFEPFWDISNGITLCRDCHYELHKRERNECK